MAKNALKIDTGHIDVFEVIFITKDLTWVEDSFVNYEIADAKKPNKWHIAQSLSRN